MHNPNSNFLIGLLGAFLLTTSSFGQAYRGVPEHHKLVDPYPISGEGLGQSVAASNEWLLINERDRSGTNTLGTLFIYRRSLDGWELQQELAPVSGSNPWEWNALFGNQTSIDGSMGIASVLGAHNFEGAVATFSVSQNQWQITGEIRSPRRDRTELFAHSIAISGSHVIVGAPANSLRRLSAGVAYFYDYINGSWEFQQAVFGNDPFTYPINPVPLGAPPSWQFYEWDAVGINVAIHGDVAAVSYKVVTSEEIPHFQGKVFVFERINGTWIQTQILRDPNSGHANQFGFHAVEISDDQILVGDGHTSGWGACSNAPDPGEIFVFQRSAPGPGNWDLIQTFEGSNASIHNIGGCVASDGFGEAMSLNGNRLLVGAPRGKRNPLHNATYGEAYLFQRDANGIWNEIQHYRHSDWNHLNNGSPVSGFGRSVSLSENYAVVGHPLAFGESNTHAAGAAYVFELPHGTAYCAGQPNSTGASATLTCTGNLDPAAGILTLWAHDLPPGQLGILLASPSQGFMANPGGSLGNLCLGAPLARVTAQLADTTGRARFATDPLNVPTSPATAVLSGETWHFQAWYRDQWLGFPSNLTEAIAVTFP